MTNDIQPHLNQITKKDKVKYLDISNRDLAGNADLSEFTSLVSLNSYITLQKFICRFYSQKSSPDNV